jgi:dCMP deaminase
MNWNQYFMNLAKNISLRSKDKKKVGAVLVSEHNNRILSTGYNGLPANVNDNIDWTNRELVHLLIIHAEMNCILYSNHHFESAILYSTLSPCINCIKIISAVNIKKIYFNEYYKDYEKTLEICRIFNIELIKLEP